MPNREAIRRHPLLTALTLLAVGWVIATAVRVFSMMEATQAYNGYIGREAVSGWIGIGVMVAGLILLLVIYSELPNDDPMPERFPPEEGRR